MRVGGSAWHLLVMAGLLAVQCSSEGPYVGGGAGSSFSALAAAYSLQPP